MKKKHLVIGLLAVGVVLVSISLILAGICAGNKSIIGGVSFPTFQYVFRCEKNGLYFRLCSWGGAAIIASIVTGLAKKRTK